MTIKFKSIFSTEKKLNHSRRPRSDPESRGNGWTCGIGERTADPALSGECGSSAPLGSRADSDPSWVGGLTGGRKGDQHLTGIMFGHGMQSDRLWVRQTAEVVHWPLRWG